MRNSLIVIFIMACLCSRGQKSDQLSEYYVDSLSYIQYLDSDVTELSKLAKEANRQGIDFYYLRMRLGVLHYNAKNYARAVPQFEKALAFLPSDTLAREYLFYSYLLNGQPAEAKYTLEKGPYSLQERLKKEKPLTNFVYVDAGYFSSNANDAVTAKQLRGPAGIYGEVDKTTGIEYGYAGLNSTFGKNTSVYSGAGYLNMTRSKLFSYGPKDTACNYSYAQYEFYFGINRRLKKGWAFNAGLHYLNSSSKPVYSYFDTTAKRYRFYASEVNMSNVVVNAGVSKNIRGFVVPSLNLSYSNINRTDIIQATGQLHYFPLGNVNFYGTTGYALSADNSETRSVFFQKLGGKLAPKAWIESYAYVGNMVNFNDANAFVVYNISDRIMARFGLSLSLFPSRHVELNLRVEHIQRQGTFDSYTDPFHFKTLNYNYSNNLITGGIKWKF